MANPYRVKLTDPAVLRRALESFLTLGVCPLRASPPPKPMAQVEIEIMLPGGRSQLCRGTVIRHVSPIDCLVQVSGALDLPLMRKVLEEAEAGAAAGAGAYAGEETGEGSGEWAESPARESTGERGGERAASATREETGERAASVGREETGERAASAGREETGERAASVGREETGERAASAAGEEAGEGGRGAPERSQESVDAYKLLQSANVAEKQKLARSGNQVLRNLLIRDRIKNVHVFVLMNPRITSEEVVEYSKLAGLSKDAIQMIAGNRVWSSSPQVTMNLVRNPATPPELLPTLLRRLSQAQLRMLAKSSDVRTQVSTLARKMIFG